MLTQTPDRLTVNELVTALGEHGIVLPGTRQKKDFYIRKYRDEILARVDLENVKPSFFRFFFLPHLDISDTDTSTVIRNSFTDNKTSKLAPLMYLIDIKLIKSHTDIHTDTDTQMPRPYKLPLYEFTPTRAALRGSNNNFVKATFFEEAALREKADAQKGRVSRVEVDIEDASDVSDASGCSDDLECSQVLDGQAGLGEDGEDEDVSMVSYETDVDVMEKVADAVLSDVEYEEESSEAEVGDLTFIVNQASQDWHETEEEDVTDDEIDMAEEDVLIDTASIVEAVQPTTAMNLPPISPPPPHQTSTLSFLTKLLEIFVQLACVIFLFKVAGYSPLNQSPLF